MKLKEAKEEFERVANGSFLMQKMRQRAWRAFLIQLLDNEEITEAQRTKWFNEIK